ncbi:PREDICTED: cartilage intermediate layer protein 1-like, partial [Tinamus guttatus]|uniref:cartilage intermediate layer protein 1-like n=1 Tax=Tinamus guttatus TaxID=94827 RepID=UPI00052ED682
VPPDTQRLVARFVDRQQRFVDTVKVLPFNSRGGAVYQEVKMMRKKEPVELDAGRTNAIPLGEARGQEPVGELVIPAGAFLRPSGEVFKGTVKASVTFLDPRDMATAGAASSDLSFANAEGEIVPLRTYGMFAVDFREGESNEVLQTGRVEVRMDARQIRMPEHLQKMKLWSLNPETGLWEEEGVFRQVKERRKKREDRTFLIGNMEIRERRLFNLDVPENRRCFVKVRAYSNEKFNAYEQLEGVVINLINLEPQPGYPTNPRAWGRFDSIVTGPNGACLPAFCDGERPDAYSAYVTATLGGEELEAVASSPKLNPNAVGVSQPYLNKLGYRRLDHDEPSFKKTAFQINVAKPDPNNIDETNGPIYPYRSLKECEEAPASANHFRFYRVEVDKYEYNVVPFKESDLTSWTGDYLSWWPNPQEFRACFIKVQIEGPQEYMVRSRNVGGSHPRTRGQLYGLRDTRSVRDMQLENSWGACVEFKCSGMLFDQSLVDRLHMRLFRSPPGSRLGPLPRSAPAQETGCCEETPKPQREPQRLGRERRAARDGAAQLLPPPARGEAPGPSQSSRSRDFCPGKPMGPGEEMPTCKRPVVLALVAAGVAVMLVVALTLALSLPSAAQEPARCQGCAGDTVGKDELARLEEAQRAKWEQVLAEVAALRSELGGVKEALQDARQHGDTCGTRLDSLQNNVMALEQALELLQRRDSEQGDEAAALQEEHRRLKEDVAQQRSSLQSQIWNVLKELQALQSRRSRGSPAAAPSRAVSLGLAALALAGTGTLLC